VKLCYIAGNYRSPTHLGRERNVLEAREVGYLVAQAGAYPVIPQSKTSHFDDVVLDEKFWLEGTMEFMIRCDSVMLTDRWMSSSGARSEVEMAEAHGIPVFECISDLEQWLAKDLANGRSLGETTAAEAAKEST
jgi:hypothetical protein